MKMVFIPPRSATANGWVARLRRRYPEVEFLTPNGDNETFSSLVEADAAFGTMDADMIAAAKSLKWLQAPFAAPPAGFYSDDLIAHPAVVTNFRGIYNDHISYHILGMMLSFTKHFHLYRDQQRERKWRPLEGSGFNSIYLPEATVLVVGAGGIGLETARLCKAIGMRVIALDERRHEPSEWIDELHAADALDRLDRDSLPWGPTHGDIHPHNALIDDEDRLTIMDFESCGEDFLAQDLVSLVWAGRKNSFPDAAIAAFHDGYDSLRPRSAEERRAEPLFLAAKELRYLCGFAGRVNAIGHNTFRFPGLDWFARSVRANVAAAGIF